MKNIPAYSVLMLLLFLIGSSCRKEEKSALVGNISCGIVKTEVISWNTHEAIIDVWFFVIDKRENFDMIRQDLGSSLKLTNNSMLLSYEKGTIPVYGHSSVVTGINRIFTSYFYDNSDEGNFIDGGIRKFMKSNPGNEYMLAGINDSVPPLRLFNNNFSTSPETFDQLLADFCFGSTPPSTDFADSVAFFECIDSLLDVIALKASNPNRDLLLLTTGMPTVTTSTINSIIAKADANNTRIHFISYLSNEDKLLPISQRTGGLFYELDDGILAQDFWVLSHRLGDILSGNFYCFKARWKINNQTPIYYTGYGKTHTMTITLTDGGTGNIVDYDLPFYLYIQ